ncbi:MAG: 2-C-methyl-D-erythritol 2,4-cyclodiphosphate synthase [Deltaproteobacteria bacterium]|jgi:2-C-methyl-D-erythritol 2,4-cyclodiphosphate synthase|nr:2-C-methyl-D-erythritol 2,4-cyclodiphosphate synthase [Deltaproteobacteria bacterium]MDP3029960.1 2-C-methyl-D-erythritol 2,4-cyclodiphosphate synthase [Deltaproteobacteria bacterium]TSA12723.1 MAG: 2-C-methyl-D-erythritol 2,4-cyclodiphosphate synthase [Deltaproteobacteria bacterium]
METAHRVGFGYDVHRLVEGRRLVIGGVEIPFEKGLLGHSDADVLIHALCDALLGAACEGDIGRHFPDDNLRYKDSSSMYLLKEVMRIIERKRLCVLNADLTLVAERPRIQKFIPQMVQNISSVLKISPLCVNIKATTTEGLGFTGQGEGMAAFAVALLGEDALKD